MSKPVTISVPHKLGVDEAKRRIEQGFGQFEQQLGVMGKAEKSWDGDRLNFAMTMIGQAITGRIDVLADAVRIEIDLPEVLALIANTIKGKLQKQGQLLLEKR